MELIFGKAKFANDFDCVIPRFGERLYLKDARHPLLADVVRRRRKSPVPISLELTRDRRTLLLSGPNTGGKTVTLKTVGLLSLMAQAALPVPAAEAEFPLFGAVLADIGDYQSIQENLSTFSAHVSNIREMALDVTPNSLVLLDELGAATDPEEGGALGVALVEHFRAAGAYTLVSTHLMALKIYGAATVGVVNGSMGFDEETLEPTYHLQLGLPGKSAGLEIATRLGMPEEMMRRERVSMSERERDVTRLLSAASPHRRDAGARNQPPRIIELDRREKEIARNGRSASRQIKELERRTDEALAKFGRRRIPSARSCRAATGARPSGCPAPRRQDQARTARTFRPPCSPQDDSRQDRIQPLRIEEACACV
jgi:DNA mismatch repair protein MutS2